MIKRFLSATVLAAVLGPVTVIAQLVTNNAELEAALDAAVPGSEIILKNQVWADVEVFIKVNGTAEEPVIIRAETPGLVFFEGDSKVNMGGSFIRFEGVIFRNPYNLQAGGSTIDPLIEFRYGGSNCSNCTLTNVLVDNYNGSQAQAELTFKWVYLLGQYNEVSYCSFLGKHGIGSIINDNRSNGEPNYHRIHHNYFADRTPVGNVNELNDQDAIRIGSSSTSMSDSHTQVYDNYFNNWFGEIEVISNKSGSNEYYNNTFRDYSGTLTLRHGNNCKVYDNYFFGEQNYYGGGIRVIGENHLIYNNYIDGINSKKSASTGSNATGGINITNGLEDSELNEYFQVIGATIVNNTFVNCDYGIRVGTKVKSNLTLPPVDLDIANNIFLNTSNKAISITTQPITSEFTGNITQNGSWDIPSGSNGNEVSTSGLLEQGEEFYRVLEGSDAIDAGMGSYSFLTTDVLGGMRGSAFDAGSEEFEGNGTKLPYTDTDVGVLIGFGASSGEVPENLSISTTSLEFVYTAGMKEFYILSNVEWAVSSDVSWLTVEPTSGSNSKAINAVVTENSSTDERIGTLTINQINGDLSEVVTVTQQPDLLSIIDAPKIIIVSAEAEGTEEPNVPELTLDENDETRWSGESSDGSAFIKYWLGENYDVVALRIKFHKGDERAFSFKVITTTGDNSETSELFTSSGTTNEFETFLFNPLLMNTEYFTITGYGNSESDWNSYLEVELYGNLSEVISGLEDELRTMGVEVYPNPLDGGLLKVISKDHSIGNYQLVDLRGNLVIDGYPKEKSFEIDVSKLSSGIYILAIPNVGQQKILIK